MYRRNILQSLTQALADTRVVLLNGARQVGKSTLAQQLAQQRGGQYLTLDDPVIAELARTDPSALVNSASGFTVIDEVQSAPALFHAIKREVDRYPVPAAIGEGAWCELRAELERRLKLVGFHPPKWAKDVPEQFAESYFDLMPIHEKLRGLDFPTTRNYLRVTMTNIHDELTKRLDAPAAAESLRAGSVAAN